MALSATGVISVGSHFTVSCAPFDPGHLSPTFPSKRLSPLTTQFRLSRRTSLIRSGAQTIIAM